MATASSMVIVLPARSGGGAFVGATGVTAAEGGLAWIVMPGWGGVWGWPGGWAWGWLGGWAWGWLGGWAWASAGRAGLARMARIGTRTSGAILMRIVIGELSSWPHEAAHRVRPGGYHAHSRGRGGRPAHRGGAGGASESPGGGLPFFLTAATSGVYSHRRPKMLMSVPGDGGIMSRWRRAGRRTRRARPAGGGPGGAGPGKGVIHAIRDPPEQGRQVDGAGTARAPRAVPDAPRRPGRRDPRGDVLAGGPGHRRGGGALRAEPGRAARNRQRLLRHHDRWSLPAQLADPDECREGQRAAVLGLLRLAGGRLDGRDLRLRQGRRDHT